MEVKIAKGRYILAVSGGVDSMVLLDLLRQKSGINLIVAHFNHGIREGEQDEKLIQAVTKKHKLLFELGKANLGSQASEDQARQARYNFLKTIMKKHRAKAIITAHHQDDVIETAILNILRGTGRRGLTAIYNNPEVIRPLLRRSKKDILKYAEKHGLVWNEDKTNQNTKYLRNYIRSQIMPQFTSNNRQQILSNIDKVAKIYKKLEYIIATLSQSIKKDNEINRQKFLTLPLEVGNELVMYWLRQEKFRQFNKKTVEKINITLRAGKAHTKVPISNSLELVIDHKSAHFDKSDRV